MTKDKWTVYTSWHLLEYCFYSWQSHIWPPKWVNSEQRQRDLFWYYLNLGNDPVYRGTDG